MQPPTIGANASNGAFSALNFPKIQQSNPTNPSSSNNTSSKQQNKKLIPADLLPEFKAAIEGSDMTKVVLVDMLKRKFPQHSKDVLKDSLDAIAVRKGMLLKDRKWVLREGV